MSFHVIVNDNKLLGTELITEELTDLDGEGVFEVERVSVETVDALVEAVKGADVLVAAAGVPITAEFFDRVPSLQAIARTGIGTDNIDLLAAKDHGVTVLNVPTYAIEEVSTHALSLLLACARKLHHYDADMKAGTWDWKPGRPIERIRGRTVGVVSLGNIARRFVEKVSAFDVEVVAYDPYVDSEEMAELGVRKVSFEELLAEAEYISTHAPLTSETERLFDAEAFEKMNSRTILVNTGRGPVVDERALCDALASGTLEAAGLDVFETEPLPEDSPLLDREDVILSPHAAWYSETSMQEVYRLLARDVERLEAGEEPVGKVDPSEIPWYEHS